MNTKLGRAVKFTESTVVCRCEKCGKNVHRFMVVSKQKDEVVFCDNCFTEYRDYFAESMRDKFGVNWKSIMVIMLIELSERHETRNIDEDIFYTMLADLVTIHVNE